MKTLSKIGLAALTALLSAAAMATPVASVNAKVTAIENGWFGEGVAVSVAAVDPVGSPLQPTGCATNNTFVIVFNPVADDQEKARYKTVNNLLIAAHLGQRPLQIVFDSSACGFGGHAKILSVRVL